MHRRRSNPETSHCLRILNSHRPCTQAHVHGTFFIDQEAPRATPIDSKIQYLVTNLNEHEPLQPLSYPRLHTVGISLTAPFRFNVLSWAVHLCPPPWVIGRQGQNAQYLSDNAPRKPQSKPTRFAHLRLPVHHDCSFALRTRDSSNTFTHRSRRIIAERIVKSMLTFFTLRTVPIVRPIQGYGIVKLIIARATARTIAPVWTTRNQ